MGIIKKIALFTMFAAMGGAALAAFTAERAYAGNYNVSTDSVNIDCSTDPEPVISGSSSSNSIVINTASGYPAIVTLSNVNIVLSSGTNAAVSITGNGNVVIALVGTNILKSGNEYAGIEKSSGSFLEIRGDGSLTATGGDNGAGIGGGSHKAGSNIKITKGTVTANGGLHAAGIGGGGAGGGASSNITITGGTVTANGGRLGDGGGAGIGGGSGSVGSNITITGGTVIANGGGDLFGGAGIGGGGAGDGTSAGGAGYDIKITGGTVTATGGGSNGHGGAGIGSGGAGSLFSRPSGAGFNITITGGTVTATGEKEGAGIGGGRRGAGSNIEITGGTITATGGADGAGIGGGKTASGNNIKISGGSVTAAGGVCGAGIGGGTEGEGSKITISNDAKVMTAGGIGYNWEEYATGAGAAIGNGGQSSGVSGNEIEPDISGLYDTGYIMYFAAGTSADAMIKGKAAPTDTIRGKIISPKTITFDPNGGTCATKTAKTVSSNNGSQVLSSLPVATRDGYTFDGWYTAKEGGDKITKNTVFSGDTTVYAHWTKKEPSPEPKPEPNPEPEPDPTPSPAHDPAEDNLPTGYTTVGKEGFLITYAGKIPFPGKSKVTVKNFGEAFSVSQGNATYTVTKIKVNKKKKLIQITGLENADKKIVKEVKKATKGADGLSFDYTPYYVKDTDKVDPKFRKDELKSVKILINGKLYKAKNTEYEYDKEKKVITFKAPNLGGSYKVP